MENVESIDRRLTRLERLLAGSNFNKLMIDKDERVSNLVPRQRGVRTVGPLSGGGDLADDRLLSLLYNNQYFKLDEDGKLTVDVSELTDAVQSDHNNLSGLTTGDPHSQYAYLDGRVGGQVLNGSDTASETLSLQSTSDSTKGLILLNDNMALTPDGGLAIALINKTGANSVRGSVVSPSSTTDMGCALSSTTIDDPIGIVYNDGIADGSNVWVIVSGIAYVLFDGSTTPSRDWFIYVSTATAGRATGQATINTGRQNAKLGHSLESAGGAGALIRCRVNFN
jgi:hypothetical protein